jgi:hypothetical protein
VFSTKSTILLIGLLAASGCAAAAPGASSPGGNRELITEGDIEQSTATNALDLVQRVRPQWLRSRGQMSIQRPVEVVVYVNGHPSGGARSLADVHIQSIREIRFLSAVEATQRFGTDHGAGAILVSLR